MKQKAIEWKISEATTCPEYIDLDLETKSVTKHSEFSTTHHKQSFSAYVKNLLLCTIDLNKLETNESNYTIHNKSFIFFGVNFFNREEKSDAFRSFTENFIRIKVSNAELYQAINELLSVLELNRYAVRRNDKFKIKLSIDAEKSIQLLSELQKITAVFSIEMTQAIKTWFSQKNEFWENMTKALSFPEDDKSFLQNNSLWSTSDKSIAPVENENKAMANTL